MHNLAEETGIMPDPSKTAKMVEDIKIESDRILKAHMDPQTIEIPSFAELNEISREVAADPELAEAARKEYEEVTRRYGPKKSESDQDDVIARMDSKYQDAVRAYSAVSGHLTGVERRAAMKLAAAELLKDMDRTVGYWEDVFQQCIESYAERVGIDLGDEDGRVRPATDPTGECRSLEEQRTARMTMVAQDELESGDIVKEVTRYDSAADTLRHIARVRDLLEEFSIELLRRGQEHDRSKLGEIEKPIFDEMTPKLKELEYGTEEYKASLKALGPALDHHYLCNSHHPEHHENGVDDMTLHDVVEMFCDWKAGTERHADGSMRKSIEHNQGRFEISEQLTQIFRNTAEKEDWG